jgi:hypothetical protein
VAEGSGKNVVKSVKVGNFRHDLVDTGMGWQVRIYNGDELYDTGMSKNSEQKGLAALEDAVAYTEKQTRTKRQGVSEYGTHPSQRVDPRTGKKYVPPKSPLGKGVAEGSQPPVCKHCGKRQGEHQRGKCPKGTKTAVGYTDYGPTKFEPKEPKQQGVAEGSTDLVQIEYWQQETIESGRWVKTKPMPRATAEKIVNSFERGEIVDVEQGVAEGYTGRETKDGTWRVFKDGQAVAVAGPFNSRDEAHAWIKKHKQGVSEAKSLKKRVRVVQGEHAGKTGWIREIKHGIHSTAPKRYYVDIDGGGQADNLPASALRLLKDQSDGQKGMAEGDHDDPFSLSGKVPAADRIPQDSTAGQDKMQAMVAQMKQRTIDSILDEKPEWGRSDLELMTAAELNQILRDIQSGEITEAEYQGRKVPLGKPMAGDVKKSKVYVRKPNGKVVKVNFGDKNMTIKKSNPKRRKSFRARHNCQNPGPRWKARYWSCRAW